MESRSIIEKVLDLKRVIELADQVEALQKEIAKIKEILDKDVSGSSKMMKVNILSKDFSVGMIEIHPLDCRCIKCKAK